MKIRAVIFLFMLCGIAEGHAQPSQRSTADGVFTEEQAKEAKLPIRRIARSAMGLNCAAPTAKFHIYPTRDSNSVGSEKRLRRSLKQPATRCLQEEHSLEDQVYLDIVTYILRFNKMPAGSQPLPLNPEALKQIVISEPPG